MPKNVRSRRRSSRTATGSASWSDALDPWFSLLDGDKVGTEVSKLKAFEAILLLIAVGEPWTRLLRATTPGWELYSHAIFGLGLAVLALVPGWRRPAFFGLAVVQIVPIWLDFPIRGNHTYLEAVFFMLGGLLDTNIESDRTLYLRAVRWIVCVIFFYAGIQKYIHGYYFQGQYLAYSLAKDTYQPILRPLLEAAEYERLVALPGKEGAGPYLVSSPLFLLVSNLIWVAEITLAPLFVWQRTRTLAVVAALILITGIEIGAREFFFGFVYTNALLLMLRDDINRKLVIPCGVAIACLILTRIGLLPEVTFY